MNVINFAAILLAALSGSAHCIGMCGGFVAAISAHKINKDTPFGKQFFLHFIYHFGRISSYALLGAVFGFLGQAVSLSYKMQGFLWFVVGCFMVALGVSLIGKIKFLTYLESSFILKPAVKKIYNFLTASKSLSSFYLLGVFNGFLPCGLVYFFAAFAAVGGSAFWGAVVMITFGVATLPAMMGFGFVLGVLKIRDVMIKISSAIIILYGIYLSYRGYITMLGAVDGRT
ncbi:MAG: sulfite exporter TauE/SafE family protein [Campylobacteraceae bacterium]|jgi:sulfite exporter TauE/SafE|nr:sulfite exporter TauE/SafE family protein [Campylobacteraceae bacterium]